MGYFIEPTIVETTNPRFKLMEEEIFGPVLTIYVYDDGDLEGALELCNTTSPYGLTGSVFAQDRYAIEHITKALTHAAGNFYVNDKPTGAVVGQQPFGGSRASGTNDKAGSMLNLLRWYRLEPSRRPCSRRSTTPIPIWIQSKTSAAVQRRFSLVEDRMGGCHARGCRTLLNQPRGRGSSGRFPGEQAAECSEEHMVAKAEDGG